MGACLLVAAGAALAPLLSAELDAPARGFVAVSLLGDANATTWCPIGNFCLRGLAVSGTGKASATGPEGATRNGEWVAVSGTGDSRGNTSVSGTGGAEGTRAVSLTGTCNGEPCHDVRTAGPASAGLAAASLDGDSDAHLLAASLRGNSSALFALSGEGSSRGAYAVSGGGGGATGFVAVAAQNATGGLAIARGDAGGAFPVSVEGDAGEAHGCWGFVAGWCSRGAPLVAASGTGTSLGYELAASGTGHSDGYMFAASGGSATCYVGCYAVLAVLGDASTCGGLAPCSPANASGGKGLLAASLLGDARGATLSASGLGDAEGLVAVSGTGHATAREGGVAVGGCDAAGACLDPL